MTLSSCYFCGTAIEEPLSEYPVVPDALAPAPDEQVTVVLCPACHRKLSTVLDRVVEAADQRQRTLDDAGADGTLPSAERDEGAEDDTAERPDDGPSIDEEAAADLLGSDDPLAGGADDGPSAPEDASGSTAGGPDGGSTGAETPDADDGTPSGTTESDAEESGEAVDDPTRSGSGGTGGRPSPSDASDAPSQATYNRVVRLLQNREFPVERDEIATVAMNAYDIPPEDFDAVIQTAVNRGVLEEEGPYLKQA